MTDQGRTTDEEALRWFVKTRGKVAAEEEARQRGCRKESRRQESRRQAAQEQERRRQAAQALLEARRRDRAKSLELLTQEQER